jgi:hypothetical protein
MGSVLGASRESNNFTVINNAKISYFALLTVTG